MVILLPDPVIVDSPSLPSAELKLMVVDSFTLKLLVALKVKVATLLLPFTPLELSATKEEPTATPKPFRPVELTKVSLEES